MYLCVKCIISMYLCVKCIIPMCIYYHVPAAISLLSSFFISLFSSDWEPRPEAHHAQDGGQFCERHEHDSPPAPRHAYHVLRGGDRDETHLSILRRHPGSPRQELWPGKWKNFGPVNARTLAS